MAVQPRKLKTGCYRRDRLARFAVLASRRVVFARVRARVRGAVRARVRAAVFTAVDERRGPPGSQLDIRRSSFLSLALTSETPIFYPDSQ
jgi:hypothetical protein